MEETMNEVMNDEIMNETNEINEFEENDFDTNDENNIPVIAGVAIGLTALAGLGVLAYKKLGKPMIAEVKNRIDARFGKKNQKNEQIEVEAEIVED